MLRSVSYDGVEPVQEGPIGLRDFKQTAVSALFVAWTIAWGMAVWAITYGMTYLLWKWVDGKPEELPFDILHYANLIATCLGMLMFIAYEVLELPYVLQKVRSARVA